MQHLDPETLARLVDEPPTAAESGHLRDCIACRLELREVRAQTEALAALAPAGPPPAAWDALEARLRDEGLIHAPARRRWSVSGIVPLPAAAAVAALALGATLWSGMRDGSADPRGAVATLPVEDATPMRAAPPVDRPASTVLASAPESAPAERTRIAPAPAAAPGARFASDAADDGGTASPGGGALAAQGPEPSLAAARELARAEGDFLAMLDRYARIGSPDSGADVVTRLAALDLLAQVTAAALERTPGDPVINGYHVAAVQERDALLRDLAESPDAEWF